MSYPELPKQISPSRAKDYILCPLKYWFGAIKKVPSKPSMAIIQGSVTHYCLEHLFTHKPEERTYKTAESYVVEGWHSLTGKPEDKPEGKQIDYRKSISFGSKEETEMFNNVKRFLKNYFKLENPQNFTPEAMEMKVFSYVNNTPILGFIDRLDKVQKDGDGVLYISDYKTGKVPDARFLKDNFFAMKVYAMVYREMHGILPHALRLIYLTSDKKEDIKRIRVTSKAVDEVRKDMVNTWQNIKLDYSKKSFKPKKNKLCGWCDYKDKCPIWNPNLLNPSEDKS